MGCLVRTSKRLLWLQHRHPWIFRDDLDRIEDAAPGDIVTLERKDGTSWNQGFIEVLKAGGRQAGGFLRLLAKGRRRADHAILFSFPEIYCLKCFFPQKIPI
jgi:23S rRNA G2069 N7-methylase RlmK/C1962 C5-methylase RlmI